MCLAPRLNRALLLATILLLGGCAGGALGPATSDRPASASTAVTSPTEGEIEIYVDELMEKAGSAEVWITPALSYLTQRRDGELVGLEHRLKSRQSLTRKVSTRVAEYPDTPLDRLLVEDAVRYTIVIEDEPLGHHDGSIHEILEIMDGIGHQVSWVKNYWPRGDDYSGVNCVLRAPNGTFWELQFHTPRSLAAKNETHVLYEEYRLESTPIERKRELFHSMAGIWETVPVPEGILEPGSLHQVEQIRRAPPP